jgi:hypothetical protein
LRRGVVSRRRTTRCPGTRRDQEAMASERHCAHRCRMKKRTLSAFLWFYCGWYAGAMIAHVAGVSPLLGPIIGAAAAFLIAGDPRGIIWSPKPAPAAPPLTPNPNPA